MFTVVVIAMIPALLLFGMWNVGHQHFCGHRRELTAAMAEGFMDKFMYGCPQSAARIVSTLPTEWASESNL